MTDHVSLSHLLSTLLRAVCRPLPPGVAVISPHYKLEKYKRLIWACDCRTTLLVQRQVTHTYKSQWSNPRLISFIQGLEESGHTVCKGRNAKRTS